MSTLGPILVTGIAGFIGFHVGRRLLEQQGLVVGIDNLNSYYDPQLKRDRLDQLKDSPQFVFEELDLCDASATEALFSRYHFNYVVHLAAQAGVRYSLIDPHAYSRANLTGFLNVLEGCRRSNCRHLVYASSSSVYGANTSIPFRTSDNVDHPVSLYGATKKANELMAHAYSDIFGIPATGLRFFTVYGPWGRPDMAYWLFTEAILNGHPVKLFNHGRMRRDFTYIDDVAESVTRVLLKPAQPDPLWSGRSPNPASSRAPWRVYNVGNHRPIEVQYLVNLIEKATGRSAIRELVPMQAGDVEETFADVADFAAAVDFAPRTAIEDGIERFVAWYQNYAPKRLGAI